MTSESPVPTEASPSMQQPYSMMPNGTMMQMPYAGYMPTNTSLQQQQHQQLQQQQLHQQQMHQLNQQQMHQTQAPMHSMQSMYGQMQLAQQQKQQQQMQQQQMTGHAAGDPNAASNMQTVSVLDFKPDILAQHQQQQLQQQQAAYAARGVGQQASLGVVGADGRYVAATEAYAGNYHGGYNGYNTGSRMGAHPSDDYYHPDTASQNLAYSRRTRSFERERFPDKPKTGREAMPSEAKRTMKEMIDKSVEREVSSHLASTRASAEAAAAPARSVQATAAAPSQASNSDEQRRMVGAAVRDVMKQYKVTPRAASPSDDYDPY